jgi:alcohol dehydrogenase class IV
MRVPAEVLPGIAAHAERDPATQTNPRAARRADYENMLRDSWSA